jgi:O-antigen/teichoic acid export membrane protein
MTFSALLPLSLFLALAGWLCALVVYSMTTNGGLKELPGGIALLGFMLMPLIMWDSYCSHLLTARGYLQYYNIGMIFGRTIGFMVMMAALLLIGLGIYSPLIGSLMSLLITVLVAIYRIQKSLVTPLRVYAKEIRSLVEGGLKLHINTIGSYLLTTIGVVILSQYRGMEEVGWYQAATQLIAVPLVLPSVITMVLFSKVTDAGPDGAWTIHRQLIWQVMLIMGLGSLLCYFIAPVLVRHLLGNEFMETVPVFRILLLALIGMCFSQLMVAQWIGRGRFLQAGLITLTVGIINVILNLIFIPKYGMYAAAWATVVAFSISILTNGIFALIIERNWVHASSELHSN